MQKLKVIADGRSKRSQEDINNILNSDQKLSSPEAAKRKATLKELIDNPDDRTWLKLFWLSIADEDISDRGVRDLAKVALNKLGEPSPEQLRYAIEVFAIECSDFNPERVDYIKAFADEFAKIKATEAIPAMIKGLMNIKLTDNQMITEYLSQIGWESKGTRFLQITLVPNQLANFYIIKALRQLGAPSTETMQAILASFNPDYSLNAEGFNALNHELPIVNMYLLLTRSPWAFGSLLMATDYEDTHPEYMVPFTKRSVIMSEITNLESPTDHDVLELLSDLLAFNFNGNLDKTIIQTINNKQLTTFEMIEKRLKIGNSSLPERGENQDTLLNNYFQSLTVAPNPDEALKWIERMFGSSNDVWNGRDFISFSSLPNNLKEWIKKSLVYNSEAKVILELTLELNNIIPMSQQGIEDATALLEAIAPR